MLAPSKLWLYYQQWDSKTCRNFSDNDRISDTAILGEWNGKAPYCRIIPDGRVSTTKTPIPRTLHTRTTTASRRTTCINHGKTHKMTHFLVEPTISKCSTTHTRLHGRNYYYMMHQDPLLYLALFIFFLSLRGFFLFFSARALQPPLYNQLHS
jgi:hypothetical protein